MCNDNLVRLLSIRERKEAIEEQLEWIDQQQAIIENIYARQKAELAKQREAALKGMRNIIREETKGREE